MNNLSPDPQRQEKARQYARISRRLMLFNLFVSAFYAILWIICGWSKLLTIQIQHITSNIWLQIALYLLIFSGILYLIDLPLSFYESYYLPHRFEISTQTLHGWISDQIKGILLGSFIGLILIEIIYLILRHFPQTWWIWVSGFLLVFNVLLAYLAPVLLFPIFNKFTPLGEDHQELILRLKNLANKAGTQVEGVYWMDMSRRTKAANAALTGMGKTRRIILGDTLLNSFTPDEIETVLAHELGHHVHKDIFYLTLVSTISTVLGMYLVSIGLIWGVHQFNYGSISNIAAFPLVLIFLGAYQLITMPIVNAFSRWRENLADEYALQITGKGEAYASALVRLADQNLAEAEPEAWVEWLLYSHPALGKRIAKARQYEQQMQNSL
ncbi:MAG: M48 family metallopeptidase [Anaerolineales bacterium]